VQPGPELNYTRTSDGVTIAYQVLGEGPTVVWLPSLGNVVAQWRVPLLRAAYERLAGSVRLVLYDGRGMGSSDRRVGSDAAGFGLDAHLRDLDAVVAAASRNPTARNTTGRNPSGAPVVLLGWYHSVATAIAYAAQRPQNVERMVLFGGSVRMRDAMSPGQTQALLSLVEQDWDLFADTAAHTWLGWGAGESGRMLAEAFRTAATPTVAKAWFDGAADIDVTAQLPQVVAPTLVLHRQSERQIPVEVSRRLAAALPRGRLVELSGASPTLFLEDATGDTELVARFLATGEVREPPPSPAPRSDGVTAREMDVLRLVAAGESNAEIARRLGIAVHTVERHAANLYRKIGARGRADAAAYALRRGIA
jgi:pimeloyl-ACP methyl ester carboxylesterase/DNA-binding CsgD family transcriptional regulator